MGGKKRISLCHSSYNHSLIKTITSPETTSDNLTETASFARSINTTNISLQRQVI